MRIKRRAIIRLCLIIFALGIGMVLCFVPMKIPGTNQTFKSFASDIRLGIDLKGGVYAVYDSSSDPNQDDISTRVQSTATRLLEMVQSEGYTEATVVVEGARIRIEVPDVSDPEDLFAILGEPAEMTFDLYDDAAGETPSENSVTGITGKNVRAAQAGAYQGGYGVYLEFDSAGTRLFHEVTSNNIGKYIKIVVNGDTKSIAEIQSAIDNGRPVISGSFSADEADTLAKQIMSGAFDVKLTLVESSIVSASLGEDALRLSLIAGIIGLSFSILFLLFIYKGLGIIADIALLIYAVLLIFFMWAFPWIQLTLPGIAGVILSLGMAEDANVIIFERIKEEYRAGKSINASVMAGFKKSFLTVMDANVTSVIAAVVMIVLGKGAVQGFGVTLLVGVILSIITAFFISKSIAKIFLTLNKTNNRFYGLYRETEPESPNSGSSSDKANKKEEKLVTAEIVRAEAGGQA